MAMKRYYVYYNDDWDVQGMHGYDNEQDALDFIVERMRDSVEPKLKNYTLIYGEIVKVVPVEVVTALKTERTP